MDIDIDIIISFYLYWYTSDVKNRISFNTKKEIRFLIKSDWRWFDHQKKQHQHHHLHHYHQYQHQYFHHQQYYAAIVINIFCEGSATNQHVWKSNNHREVLKGAQYLWQKISLDICQSVSLTSTSSTNILKYLATFEKHARYFKSDWNCYDWRCVVFVTNI